MRYKLKLMYALQHFNWLTDLGEIIHFHLSGNMKIYTQNSMNKQQSMGNALLEYDANLGFAIDYIRF